MPINESFPKAGLSGQQVTVSKDQTSVLYCGQEVPIEYFVKVTVPSLLGFYPAGSRAAFELLSELDANGFSLAAYGKHTAYWSDQVIEHRETLAARAEEVRMQQERWAAMTATPEEIAKANQERIARRSRQVAQFGRPAGGAFGDL